ncbi:TonB-dependent receptor [Xanthomonas rydalmerensis]|uniref:TonB-dependent receptor n=1 Tax=Xanthomonas rydalmerensis TaxID=3046274 RepID=A0ABZ0JU82_9XANT|nr:TonB-dependent receptor [Xanthomonas sp. DM-2023]WOS42630.1 TonB-dependent receptor [Xanthomonas sp. DM-2023]WOS46816.1 TonB-dependent receptor [Xanthomonas sp. DM-2023]WOS50996.1 TonB-dependent receptor [Xanthomonas sp. DM-2023]WOS55176.1 TonB-dependent receptor [Xanthomonas sp. DM-2023]WOS59358.1 TonB-dependent receptor [Xanthomonas sp. DM-2023]
MFPIQSLTLRPALFRSTALYAALTLALSGAAHAQPQDSPAAPTKQAAPEILNFSIPAGPLSATLQAIERIGGTRIQFQASDVQDIRAPAISSQTTAQGAVQAAVSGTGLTMASAPDGSIRVFVQQLDSVVVTAKRDEAETGFRASRSSTATRGDADLRDVPQSVTVLTAKVFETQQTATVEDALRNVAGVIVRPGAQGASAFNIRGFGTASSTLSNGLSDPNSVKTNIAGVERVEVLKGPQALLAGANALGGTLNIVTKKPTTDPIRDVTLSYGSHAERTGTVDLAGALNDSKELSYRVIASSTRASGSAGGYDGRTQDYGLGEIRWKNADTDFIAGVSADRSHVPPDRYTVALRGSIEPPPPTRPGNRDDGVDTDTRSAFYTLQHSFTDALQFTSRMQRTSTDLDLSLWTAQFPVSTVPLLLSYSGTVNRTNQTTTSGDHYLSYTFNTGPLEQRLVAGVNHSHFDNDYTQYSGPRVTNRFDAPTQPLFPVLQSNDGNRAFGAAQAQSQRGLYLQDTVRWDKWTLVAGLRHSSIDIGQGTIIVYPVPPAPGAVLVSNKQSLSKNTVNAGLIYNLSSNTSLYASYAEGFSPLFSDLVVCGTDSTSTPPTQSKSKELGVKSSNADNTFSWTASVFQIDQLNLLQRNRPRNCNDLIDGQRSRGAELEASGTLMPGLNLIFNYSYVKVESLFDPTLRPGGQPRNQASLWSTYDFQSERLRDLSLAFGISGWSESILGVRETDPRSPGGARIDAGIAYTRPKWSLRFGAKNLANRTLYGYSTTNIYVPIYDKRTYTLTYERKL